MKKTALVLLLAAGMTSMVGCMGQMALNKKLMDVNMKIVSNRYGRAGIFMLFSPGYAVCSGLDLLIFNSIEFWTKKNPISGKSPAVVDKPYETWIQVGARSIDESTTETALSSASFRQIDENTTVIKMIQADGTHRLLMGKRRGDGVEFYVDGKFISTVTIEELNEYVFQKQGHLASLAP